MIARAWWALGAIGLALVSCSSEATPPELVLLISIDTLRADHLGVYGYDRPTSPHLDALAAEGVVFENAMSTAPWTLSAHASLLTGLYPTHHGLGSPRTSLPSGLATLASLLADAGWETAAVVNSAYLTERHALDRGFERFAYVTERATQMALAPEISDRALAWIDEPRDAPLFLFLHYYDVHSDYGASPEILADFVRPYAGRANGKTWQLLDWSLESPLAIDPRDAQHLVDLYDAGIREMDDEIGRLLGALRDRGLLGRTLVIVTSDHGEEFFEHGGVLHGRTQHQHQLGVPLLMRGPGVPRGRRVVSPVSLVDVAPTLLAFAGVPAPPSLDGVDLSPTLRGGDLGERTLFGEADHYNGRSDTTRSARRGRYKLHLDRTIDEHQLFDLSTDPGETIDVQAAHPELTEELLAALRELARGEVAAARARELTAVEKAQLERLGYVQ